MFKSFSVVKIVKTQRREGKGKGKERGRKNKAMKRKERRSEDQIRLTNKNEL